MSINSVSVNSWGNGNDCWWNIAAEQAGEGASAEKINQIMLELQEYNEDKNSAVVRQNDVLYEGEQIYIPLEYAMDEIQEKITTAKTDYSNAADDVIAKQKDLNIAKSEYESAQNTKNANEHAILDETIDQLKQAQEDAQDAYDKAVEECNDKKEALEQLKEDYDQTKKDYEDEYNAVQDKYKELDEEIEGIDGFIAEKEEELEEAKQEEKQEEATPQSDTGIHTGIPAIDDPFNDFLSGNLPDTFTPDDQNPTPSNEAQPGFSDPLGLFSKNGGNSNNTPNATSAPTGSATQNPTESQTVSPTETATENPTETDTPVQNALDAAEKGDTSQLKGLTKDKTPDEIKAMLEKEGISEADFEEKMKKYGVGQPQQPTRPAQQ